MVNADVPSILDHAERYVSDITSALETEEYQRLAELDQDFDALMQMLGTISINDMQRYKKELDTLGLQLSELREVMMDRREVIREKLEGAGGASAAAKAYLKSTLVNDDKKS